MKIVARVLFCLLITVTALAVPARPGKIKGTVVSKTNREVLQGATVVVANTKTGAITDSEGKFEITGIAPGQYNLELHYIGYENLMVTDVQVGPEKITFIQLEMQEHSVQTGDVVVRAGYFNRDDINPAGVAAFNAEEIKRAPGSAGDISRILLALPGTAKVADNSNDLAVRGGSPSENGFYIENIPIPNINHFPVQGATGGPIGMLNIDFIDNVKFLTSGFSASFGDRLSSIVDIKMREGNRENYEYKAKMDMAGFGGTAEGPLGKDGYFLLGAQKSFLDLLVSAIGTGVAPRYGDIQGKGVYNFGAGNTVTLLQVFGQSQINSKLKDAVDQGQPTFGEYKAYQNTTGLNWEKVWGKNLFSNTSVSYSYSNYLGDFKKTTTGQTAITLDNYEGIFTLRNVNYWTAGKRVNVEFGLEARRTEGKFDVFVETDTNRLGTVVPAMSYKNTTPSGQYSVFTTVVTKIADDFRLSTGVRVGYGDINEKVTISPRAAFTYAPNEVFSVSLTSGLFYQQLPLVLAAQKEDYKKMRDIEAAHYGISLEYMLTADTRLTVDVYDKEYRNLPVTSLDPYSCVMDNGLSLSRFRTYESLENFGKAYTRGIEVLVQKKLAQDIYGLVSGSYFRSRYSDYTGVWRDRVYDNQFLFSIIGGYKPSREWDFSIKWTVAGGTPYTPFDQQKSYAADNGIIDITRVNAERAPVYHTMNARVDRKFYFEQSYIDVYFDVLNAYNHENVAMYYWNTAKNKQDTLKQWSILPVLGVLYNF